MALWNENGFSVLELEVGEVPLPNGNGNLLCVNFLPKPFTTWSVPDEIVRLSMIWLVRKGITKRFNGLQWTVNAIRLAYGINQHVVIAKYWSDSDKLRWMEKQNRWHCFFNPLRRVPLQTMIAGRDFRGFTPDRLLAEMSTLHEWPDARVLLRNENPIPIP